VRQTFYFAALEFFRDFISISEGSKAGTPEKYSSCILHAPQSDASMSGSTAFTARAAVMPSFYGCILIARFKTIASGKTTAVILKDMDIKTGDLFKKPRSRITDAQRSQMAGDVIRHSPMKGFKDRVNIMFFHKVKYIFMQIVGILRNLSAVWHIQYSRIVLREG